MMSKNRKGKWLIRKVLSILLATIMIVSATNQEILLALNEEMHSHSEEAEATLLYEANEGISELMEGIYAILTSAIDDSPFLAVFDPENGRISMFTMRGEDLGFQYVENEAAFWELVEFNREITSMTDEERFGIGGTNRNVTIIDAATSVIIEYDEDGNRTETPLIEEHMIEFSGLQIFMDEFNEFSNLQSNMEIEPLFDTGRHWVQVPFSNGMGPSGTMVGGWQQTTSFHTQVILETFSFPTVVRDIYVHFTNITGTDFRNVRMGSWQRIPHAISSPGQLYGVRVGSAWVTPGRTESVELRFNAAGHSGSTSVTVHYRGNGHTGGFPPASHTVTTPGNLILRHPDSMTRSGHAFAGWRDADTWAIHQPGQSVHFNGSGNRFFDAIWEPVQINWVTIQYQSFLHTSGNIPSSHFIAASNWVQLRDQGTLHRQGYTFGGWQNTQTWETIPSGGSMWVPNNSPSVITMQPIWHQITQLTVTVNPNGGTANGSNNLTNVTLMQSSTVNDLTIRTNPARANYTFAGWSLTQTGAILPPNTVLTNNATYFARWTQNNITVTINPNGGTANNSINPTNITLAQGSTAQDLTTRTNPTRANHIFAGWSLTQTGAIISPNTVLTNNTTYVARWTQNNITVTVNPNGGTANSSTVQTTVPLSIGSTISDLSTRTNPTRTGHTFDGWSLTQTGAILSPNTPLTNNQTYFARWTQSITITLNANGGTVNQASVSIPQGSSVLALPTPTRTDYTFAAWHTAQTGNNPVGIMNNSMTVFARWRVNLSFQFMDGVTTVQTVHGRIAGTSIGANTLPVPSLRPGFRFDGWFDQHGNRVTEETIIPNFHTPYYARWSPSQEVDLIWHSYNRNDDTGVWTVNSRVSFQPHSIIFVSAETLGPTSEGLNWNNSVALSRNTWSNALGVPILPAPDTASAHIRSMVGSTSEILAELGLNVLPPGVPPSFGGFAYYPDSTFEPFETIMIGGIEREVRRIIGQMRIFTRDEGRSTNLITATAVHELGHALGWEGHSRISTDVMYWQASSSTLGTVEARHLRQIYDRRPQ